ncbi:MAG: PTS sugar transporter subunit IIC [Hungatella sp.]|jgi:fructoselysine and glucoselysine-specific PTS system IIC component|uniref:PTS sugar transporter subunit IIC n=1 Tax=Clostridium sp. NkU-1 TaxID=1095009 RepID=UPI0006D07949|nr:PTS sugar transporter subunit IIC [Hungatella sp.]MDR1772789.1 PTS sugar transporter subunit IIC [Hungatella sp.]MDR2022250.1 PTS sugar transporter subunit IIC [Hungatella sp.]
MQSLGFQAALLFLVAAFGYLNSFFGSGNIGRPIIMSTLTGLILGDMQLGIITGATLELIWLGAFPIGASNPPDYTAGSVIGTAYVILSGSDAASAVLLAVPISTLCAMLSNFLMMFVVPMLGARADRYAEKGDCNGVDNMHYMAIIVQVIPQSLVVALGFYLGVPVMEQVVNSIPAWLNDGLNYATGIIPAIGFAMIARMIMNKQLSCFLFLGFLLAAYLKMPVIGLAGIGCCIVAFLHFNSHEEKAAVEGGSFDDNEF